MTLHEVYLTPTKRLCRLMPNDGKPWLCFRYLNSQGRPIRDGFTLRAENLSILKRATL